MPLELPREHFCGRLPHELQLALMMIFRLAGTIVSANQNIIRKCPVNALRQGKKRRGGFGPATQKSKMFLPVFMRACPRSISRLFPCRCEAMREYRPSAAGRSPCKFKEVGSGAMRRAAPRVNRCCAATRNRCRAGLAVGSAGVVQLDGLVTTMQELSDLKRRLCVTHLKR